MNYVEFFKDLSSNKARGIYLIESDEEYLNTSLIEEAERFISLKDFNLTRIKGDVDFEDLKNTYETYPVMEDKRLIIWQNIDLSKNSIKSYDQVLDGLMEDMEDFPDYVVLLIFAEDKVFKGKFYKAVKKYGKLVKVGRLNNRELHSFIGKRFAAAGKKISNKDIKNIIDRFSYLSYNSEIDLFEVVNSVDKIISNSDEPTISEADIEDQLNKILNLNIFNLTDAIGEKSTKKALKTLEALASSGEDLFMVYHMLIRQLRIMVTIKYLEAKHYNDSFLRKAAKVGNFELKKSKGFVRNFSLAKLIRLQERLFDMEVRQKSENFDMEMELMKFVVRASL